MTKLNTLLLDEVPITDTLQDVFNNQNLKYLTLRRPRKRFNKAIESERKVGRLFPDGYSRVGGENDLNVIIRMK